MWYLNPVPRCSFEHLGLRLVLHNRAPIVQPVTLLRNRTASWLALALKLPVTQPGSYAPTALRNWMPVV